MERGLRGEERAREGVGGARVDSDEWETQLGNEGKDGEDGTYRRRRNCHQ